MKFWSVLSILNEKSVYNMAMHMVEVHMEEFIQWAPNKIHYPINKPFSKFKADSPFNLLDINRKEMGVVEVNA